MSDATDRELLIRIDERTQNTAEKLATLTATVMDLQQKERFCSLHRQRIANLEESLKIRSTREWGLFAGLLLVVCRMFYDIFK